MCGHVIAIVETKAPKEKGKKEKTPKQQRGVTRLETYMALEPHARVGIWVDNADASSPAIFVYRDEGGKLVQRNRLLRDLPPGRTDQPGAKETHV
jgi:hypothetical protein